MSTVPARPSAGGWYADAGVPVAVRTEIERLTARVERDRAWQADAPARRFSPAVPLIVIGLAGAGLLASGESGAILVGVLLLLFVALLCFVPARRARRRRRLRRLGRRWAAHRVERSSVGPAWHPALDSLADSERWLRQRGLPAQAGLAAAELGRALERAASGGRVEREISRVGASLGVGGPEDSSGDADVRAVRADLARAVTVRDGLLDANVGAATRLAQLAVATDAELTARTAAVEAVRERALGTLSDAVLEASTLLPDPPPRE